MAPGQDPEDLSLPVPPGRPAGDLDFHLIPVEGSSLILLSNINVGLFLRHRHEAETLPGSPIDTGLLLRLAFVIFPPPGNCDLSFCLQFLQHLFQFLAPGFWNLQQHGHLFELHGGIQVVADKIIDYLFLFLSCSVHSLSFPCM